MAEFYGTSTHTVDSKGRFSLPQRIRQALPEGDAETFVFIRGPERCLYGYSVPEFEKFKDKVTALGIGTATGRAIKKMLGGSAVWCEIDGQGRVLVPPAALKAVEISDSVVVVGAIDHVEVWSPAIHEAEYAEVYKQYVDGLRQHFP